MHQRWHPFRQVGLFRSSMTDRYTRLTVFVSPFFADDRQGLVRSSATSFVAQLLTNVSNAFRECCMSGVLAIEYSIIYPPSIWRRRTRAGHGKTSCLVAKVQFSFVWKLLQGVTCQDANGSHDR